MKVYILGKTAQDRGNQLEALTADILDSKGYTNIIKRKISSGGQEIDVSADLVHPAFVSENTIRLICECKAHANVTNTTDWLKFLGKVFIEERQGHAKVNGCFISLHGVNGNVLGSYEQLRINGGSNIELVTGELLFDVIKKRYKLANVKDITNYLKSLTDRDVTNISLAYYDENIYWIVEFPGDEYSIFRKDGSSLGESIEPAELSREIISGKYVDIKAEKEKRDLDSLYEKSIVIALLEERNPINRSALFDKASELTIKQNSHLTEEGYEEAINSLLDRVFFEVIDESYRVVLDNFEQKRDLYLFLLSGGAIPISALKSEAYKSNINRELLEGISKIQMGTIIPEEEVDGCLFILKVSPSALSTVLNEIQMIVHHRKEQQGLDERLEEHDSLLLLRMVYEAFEHDFSNVALTTFLFKDAGIHELDVEFKMTLKSKEDVICTHKNRRRSGIGELAENLGGGLIRILMLNDAPDPANRYAGANGDG